MKPNNKYNRAHTVRIVQQRSGQWLSTVHPTLPVLLRLEWSHLLPWILRWRISIHLRIHFNNTEIINTKKNSCNDNHAICTHRGCGCAYDMQMGAKLFSHWSYKMSPSSQLTWARCCLLCPTGAHLPPSQACQHDKVWETDHMEMGYAAIPISLHIVIVMVIKHGSGLWNLLWHQNLFYHLLFSLLLDLLSLGSNSLHLYRSKYY
jgi:hypothetical protein